MIIGLDLSVRRKGHTTQRLSITHSLLAEGGFHLLDIRIRYVFAEGKTVEFHHSFETVGSRVEFGVRCHGHLTGILFDPCCPIGKGLDSKFISLFGLHYNGIGVIEFCRCQPYETVLCVHGFDFLVEAHGITNRFLFVKKIEPSSPSIFHVDVYLALFQGFTVHLRSSQRGTVLHRYSPVFQKINHNLSKDNLFGKTFGPYIDRTGSEYM